jgi:hypothetical protein
MKFLIDEKNVQIEQIIGFVKLVLDINLVTYVQSDEAVKYGCITLKSHMNCKRIV